MQNLRAVSRSLFFITIYTPNNDSDRALKIAIRRTLDEAVIARDILYMQVANYWWFFFRVRAITVY
ncbi:MAG: hypothetical protein ACRC9T_07325 [Vibrionaceae bacterium]